MRGTVPIAIVLLALVLRLIRLTHFGLGNDEIAEVFWSSLPFRQMLHRVSNDGVHPPLDYFMQFVLDRISNNEWVWRLPRVLAGTAIVALMMPLTRRWFDERAGWIAALLLAVSPIHIRFSQEVRPYAFGLFWMVLAIVLLQRANLVAWFIAVYLAGMTLYFAGMIAGLVSIAVILLNMPALRRKLPLIILGWIVLYAPWLPIVIGTSRAKSPLPPEHLTWSWLTYHLQTLGTGDWQNDPVSIGSWLLWALALTGVGIAIRNRRTISAAVWLVIGLLLQIAVLQMHPHYPAIRHLLPAWLAVFPLIGCAASRLRWFSAIVLVVIFFDGRTLRDYYNHGRPEWNRVAQFVADRVKPGERVLVANNWTDLNFGWYWHREPRIVDVEKITTHIDGPAWFVISSCGIAPELARMPLAQEFHYTNHCEVRYIPAGASVDMPQCP
jgi:4-amino-4-deoxy-L-arabinose transferase-like glycosyltransferase